ncbi:hypothetical protein SK128_008514, partial [Halocaridina rubra]
MRIETDHQNPASSAFPMKIKFALLLWWLRFVAGRTVPGEIYSSLAHVHGLFIFDHRVGQTLLRITTTTFPESQRYKEMYNWAATDANYSSSSEEIQETEVLTGNPLHIYALMKRILYYWYFVQYELVSAGLSKEVQRWTNQTTLPSGKDLAGTALALARLQQVYNLPIEELVQGTILMHQSSVRLTTFDCLKIANESHWVGNYVSAWQWYFYTLKITGDLDLKQHIWDLMGKVAYDHDNQAYPVEEYSFPHPLSQYPVQEPPKPSYFNLCRGIQSIKDGEAYNRLKCHISDRGSPYLRLQPVKYEELHYEPILYFYYDILSSDQIQVIKDLALDNLTRANFIEGANNEYRVTHTSWLKNKTHPILESLAKRMAYITGLHIYEGPVGNMAGEDLQVQCYGVGGHYLLHYDPLYKTDSKE